MKLEDFIGALEGVGLEIGVEEILDTLWLASQGRALSLYRRTDITPPPEPASLPPTPAAAGRTIPEPEKPDPQVRPGSTAAGTWNSGTADVYALGSLSAGDRTIKAIPVAVPAGRALHNRLGLMRALKPLRQRWPSHRSSELDEERTAEATAELRAFYPNRVYPVLRPSPVPWFDVDLIQEDDPAIELWSEVLRDFAQMLRETGAFRVVRTWRLRLPPRGAKVAISPGSTYTRPAAALEAPNGARVWSRSLEGGARRLIIFASHGSSIHWPDGSYARLLKTWSRHSGSVLLHLMARERWPHTLLGEPHGLCATDSPGPASATLRVEPFWWRVPLDEITSLLPLPAVALDADDVDEWAKMYMARGRHCSVFLLDPKHKFVEGDSASELVETRELDEWRIANLRQVSPEAFQLAVYLSTSPFTIPVARLIQAAKFGPGAGLGQLAEVFLSGLLVALAPKSRRYDPSTIYYDFRPEARAILLRSLRDADAKKIAAELQKRISTHIEAVSGQPFTFRGLVPKADGTFDLPIWAQPFARVGLSLLGLHQTAGTAPAEAATVQGSETERAAVLAEALGAARGIRGTGERAEALAALAPHLPAEQHAAVLSEALTAAQSIEDSKERARLLAALAPHLPAELFPEALALARSIEDDDGRARLLAALAPHLPAEQRAAVLSEALALARSIEDDDGRAQVLGGLAPHLPAELFPEALALARSIEDDDGRARLLAALAPHLPAEQRAAVLSEALALARSIEDDDGRARLLAALAPHLPAEQRAAVLSEALTLARSIEDDDGRAQVLGGLAPHLPAEQRAAVLSEALASARSIEDGRSRAVALAALAPHLPAELFPEALALARSIEDDDGRAQVLGGLAPHLPAEQHAAVLSEALTAAQSIEDSKERARLLAALAPHLPAELFPEALALARSIEDDDGRARLLAALAPHLPAEQRAAVLSEALASARSIEDGRSRAVALAEGGFAAGRDQTINYAPSSELVAALTRPLEQLNKAHRKEIQDLRDRLGTSDGILHRVAAILTDCLSLWFRGHDRR